MENAKLFRYKSVGSPRAYQPFTQTGISILSLSVKAK
jgi:hypothetical protein